MKNILGALVVVVMVLIASCELFDPDSDGLSSDEIVEGLKKALEIGADSAASELSLTDGYYRGHATYVKIPLPDEAEEVRKLIADNDLASLINLDDEFENVVLSVNRAAESAAKDAVPVFRDAIRGLSITQGLDILNGLVPEDAGLKSADFDSTAATTFLKLETFDALTGVYAPKINTALDQDLGLGFTAIDAWNTLTTTYNSLLNSSAVQSALLVAQFSGNPINLPDAIETDLGVFSTHKALDGLFFKVGVQEKKIRKDPFKWASDIIEKVFGSLF